MEYDHQHPTRWSDLTQEEKDFFLRKTNTVLQIVSKNPDMLVPYDYLNKTGLVHLYRFLVESWNDTHPGKIEILENGIVYRK